jgi:LPXTG-site transpeptidase (sortase) family protein
MNTNPWRTIGWALILSVVALVAFNAQYIWANLRYSAEPVIVSQLQPTATQAQSDNQQNQSSNSASSIKKILSLPANLRPIGITNADLARIPIGASEIDYSSSSARTKLNLSFAKKQSGKLFIQVQSLGELWYVNPADHHRYLVPDLSDANNFIAALVSPESQTKPAESLSADTLSISSLNLLVPVIYVEQANEDSFQAGLKNGVVHYPGTPNPGEYGNVYIFGHSSDYWWSNGKYRTVFAILPRIKIGAEILLSNHSGKVYTYKVTESKVVAASDTHYLGQYDYKSRLLTLQTSWPIGTALKRYVVLAELVTE